MALRTGKYIDGEYYMFERWTASKSDAQMYKKTLKNKGYSVRVLPAKKNGKEIHKIFKRK